MSHFRGNGQSEDKLKKELHHIATELVFMLERYTEGCARVARDNGKNNDDCQPEKEAVMDYPELNLTDVSGDWRILDPHLMYRIRELPVLQDEARGAIADTAEIPVPPLHKNYFRERQYPFARLGIRAVILAIGLPQTRLTGNEWSRFPCSVSSGDANVPCVLQKLHATENGTNR